MFHGGQCVRVGAGRKPNGAGDGATCTKCENERPKGPGQETLPEAHDRGEE